MQRRWLRLLLATLALGQVVAGAWALFAPRSWYDDFPRADADWVSSHGPYNDHLVTDVGAGLVALAVLAAWAAVSLERRVVQGAMAVWLVFAVPHLAFHIGTADRMPAGENVQNLALLGWAVVVPIGILLWLWRQGDEALRPERPPARAGVAPASPTGS